MTKMLIDRATVEQALEAQKALLSLVEDPCPYDAATTRAAARASITALEAALAEPVQEPQEPVQHEYEVTANDDGTFSVELPDGDELRIIPPQRPAEPQEPAFHGFMSADGTQVDLCFSPSAPRSDGTYATAYYAAPPQRPAEPVQEPVAWMHEWKPNAPVIGKSLHWFGSSPHFDDVKVTPLYTTPPQRKPLTEEEIRDLLEADFLGCEGKRNWPDDLQVFRLAERTHGIGGKDD